MVPGSLLAMEDLEERLDQLKLTADESGDRNWMGTN